MNRSEPPHPFSYRRIAARAVPVFIAMLVGSGLAAPAAGAAGQPYDAAVLSEMAQDVLERAAQGPAVPAETAPHSASGAALAEPDNPAEPDAPAAHSANAREGVIVAIPTGATPTTKGLPAAAAVGYQSNSWRQRTGTERALGFSSGVLAPAVGLDSALSAQAESLRKHGRDVVYGFLLLTGRPDAALDRALGALGVELLGRHDDHYKARLPVASLEAVAALPEVEWVGLSAPEQKLSLDLTELRGRAARTEGLDEATPMPVTINLFEGDATGEFRRQLEAAGAAVGEYDPALHFYRAVATGPVLDRILALDFVLFVEPIGLSSASNDQSTPLIDADMIRPGASFGHTRYSGASTLVGILDSGFNMGGDPAAVAHRDLLKAGCGVNFTTDAAGPFNDQLGHGTHVLGTLGGDGTSDPRYRGVATGIGTVDHIRVAKIWTAANAGMNSWMESAMDYMSNPAECGSAPPEVINISGGTAGVGLVGTDSVSRKLDDKVWTRGQAYVVAAGNEGPFGQTVRAPGVAKNAITVGNVFDHGGLVGDIANTSSRGPAGDGRMKPNVVAPGHMVTSARAGTTSLYREDSGTSMAAPHVTGLAATLMQHYSYFKGRPALLRAHLMATSIAHDDITDKNMDYGLGRVSSYVAHWDHPNNAGWHTHRFWGTATAHGYAYNDVVVPAGARRLVVVMTWDEPAASAGASRAVTYDLDLWADLNIDCTEPTGRCGEYVSQSAFDNMEYLAVNNPPAGTYRLKVWPHDAPTTFPLRWGMTAVVIRGDPTPTMTASVTTPASNPVVGTYFPVDLTVATQSYVVASVLAEAATVSPGVTPAGGQTQRLDGAWTTFADRIALGNLVPMLGRSASFWYRADTVGTKSFTIRAWSENGGEVIVTRSVQVVAALSDLVGTAMASDPSAPALLPGSSFSVTDTVQNAGVVASGSAATRYYLSLDAVRSADDRQLNGSRSVPGLAPGAVHTGTATATIPSATPLGSYFLLVCADAQNAVVESNEGNNCIASAGATVTVGRPDLVQTAVGANPPAPARAPGTTFTAADTVQNAGPVGAGKSKTRYYLSLDAVKGAGDTLLTGSRSIPALSAGAGHSGTATVTIPSSTPLGTYFLLACADDQKSAAETDEGNNCTASAAATVTVTKPDLVQTAVSAPPATAALGASFAVSDTAQNVEAVASKASATRYYLSLDASKGSSDKLLNGGRSVPGLAPGGSHTGSTTVTIPSSTPLDTYFLLACADNGNAVGETNETNNCTASSTRVTVTP